MNNNNKIHPIQNKEDLNLNFYKSNGEFTESKVKRGDINTLTYSPTNRESNSYNPE